jgi:outer membrane protein TolC
MSPLHHSPMRLVACYFGRALRRTTRALRLVPALLLASALIAPALDAQPRATLELTLQEAIARAQRDGFQSKAAVAQRDAARQRDRAFAGALLPQLSLNGNVPVYNRSIIPVLQPDGSTVFRPQQQNESALTMQVSQRLPITGGDLFVNSSLSRLDVAGERDFRTWSSTPMLVGVRQDLFRPNRQRWDNKEQELRMDVAERAYREALEDVALSTTTTFFDHFNARIGLENAEVNVAVNDTLFTLNKGRYEVGRIGENDLLQSELALLRARNAVDAARLEHDRTLAALRLALGVGPSVDVSLVAPTAVPRVSADTARAVREALRNRASVLELELGDVQAERRISEARFGTGPGATLQASMGFNQTGADVGAVYQDLRQAQRFAVGVSVPVVQWGVRSGQVEAARADRNRQGYLAEQSREQTAQDAHFAALQLALAERQLDLAAKADTVGAKRFEVTKNRYVIGRIGMDNLYQAQTEKDGALQSYLQALRGYWVAYYRLRRVTMYDFEADRPITP